MHNFHLIGDRTFEISQILTNNNLMMYYIICDQLKLISYQSLYGILNSKIMYFILLLIALL